MVVSKSKQEKKYLAFDLGAESSRAVVGIIGESRLDLQEIHRFPTRNVSVCGTMYWDILYIYSEILQGMREYVAKHGPEVDGIGIDTWGVDFGLLGPSGTLLSNPVQYRDHRIDGILEEAFEVMPKEEIYKRSGIQLLPINTLYQLWAMHKTAPEVLGSAHCFLMIPDLLNYFLTGRQCCEYSEASTSQLLDIRHQGKWSRSLMQTFSLPMQIFPEVVPPGTLLGPLQDEIAASVGLSPAPPVIAPCTHDSGSAVAGTPAESDNWAYISCGTWSILGAELEQPEVSERALEANFTNEGGYGGTIRFLKNIMGLWVLQQCRKAWQAAGEEFDYVELTGMANKVDPFPAILNIDDARYLNPPNMLDVIADQCRETGQAVLQDVGQIARAVLEGVALRYHFVMKQLESVLDREIGALHMVGGGIQNRLLCQMASDATGKPVIAGPVEATATGNLIVQAISIGQLKDLPTARKLVAATTDLKEYKPQNAAEWNRAIQKYTELYTV